MEKKTVYEPIDSDNKPPHNGMYGCVFTDGSIGFVFYRNGSFSQKVTHWLRETPVPNLPKLIEKYEKECIEIDAKVGGNFGGTSPYLKGKLDVYQSIIKDLKGE